MFYVIGFVRRTRRSAFRALRILRKVSFAHGIFRFTCRRRRGDRGVHRILRHVPPFARRIVRLGIGCVFVVLRNDGAAVVACADPSLLGGADRA